MAQVKIKTSIADIAVGPEQMLDFRKPIYPDLDEMRRQYLSEYMTSDLVSKAERVEIRKGRRMTTNPLLGSASPLSEGEKSFLREAIAKSNWMSDVRSGAFIGRPPEPERACVEENELLLLLEDI